VDAGSRKGDQLSPVRTSHAKSRLRPTHVDLPHNLQRHARKENVLDGLGLVSQQPIHTKVRCPSGEASFHIEQASRPSSSDRDAGTALLADSLSTPLLTTSLHRSGLSHFVLPRLLAPPYSRLTLFLLPHHFRPREEQCRFPFLRRNMRGFTGV
jgi:hypothetical protein